MAFSTEWFKHTAEGNFEKFLQKYKGLPNLNFLEVGAFEGMATVWLLENILTDKTSKITTIDALKEGFLPDDTPEKVYDRLKENTKPFKDQVTIIIEESQTALRTLKEEFDFVYIDGSHTAPNVLEDAILSFRLLKSGGIMIFDDYEWNHFLEPHRNPKLGIDAFIQVFGQQFKVLLGWKTYQVVIEKL